MTVSSTYKSDQQPVPGHNVHQWNAHWTFQPKWNVHWTFSPLWHFIPVTIGLKVEGLYIHPKNEHLEPEIGAKCHYVTFNLPVIKPASSVTFSFLCYDLSWCVLWPIFPINCDILFHGNILTWCILSSLFPFCNILSHCNTLFMVWHLAHVCVCVCVCVWVSVCESTNHGLVCCVP
jgi:hypothetical protein